MLFKILALIAALMPVILFVRAVFFRRSRRLSEEMKTFRRNLDLALWIAVGVIGGIVAIALGKLAWTWWFA
jgi:hypothetical protein